MIAESKTYDYGIVFSDFGFGPKHPWGLVFLSQDNFGADYCWYSRLEDAFADSRLTDEPNIAEPGGAVNDLPAPPPDRH